MEQLSIFLDVIDALESSRRELNDVPDDSFGPGCGTASAEPPRAANFADVLDSLDDPSLEGLTLAELLTEDELALIDEEIPDLREAFIVRTVQNAFGLHQGGRGKRPKPSAEAWEWILSENRDTPFSFEQCCRQWGADPDTVLDWLKYYKKKLIN